MSGKTKTRDRILSTSLELFNRDGEPKTTTNHIADEMDISPGNLYYHFRNKDEIVGQLFQAFEKRILELLSAAESRPLSMEDMWFFLHLVFEAIWDYRFLYLDLDNILRRNRVLRRHFGRIVTRKTQVAGSICEAMVKARVMMAEPAEIDALSRNMVVVATYWLSFENSQTGVDADHDRALARGVYQVMALVAPFLEPLSRAHFNALGRRYLE